jgi:hypothetical protein
MLLPYVPDDLEGGKEIRLENIHLLTEYLESDWKQDLINRGFSVVYIESNGTTEPFRCVRVWKGANKEIRRRFMNDLQALHD